jgi:imidazolonepropionase-like amidohydrolase
MENKFILFCLFVGFSVAKAQRPEPAPVQGRDVVIEQATVHVGNGNVVVNGAVWFSGGILKYVGPMKDIPSVPSDAQRMRIQNAHVYPGFIACNTTLGLTEIEAVRATNDLAEVGLYNPNVRSAVAFFSDSKVIPTVRSNGVLLAEACPRGGVISGTSSLMQLDAWNYTDALVRSDAAMHLNWPSAGPLTEEDRQSGRMRSYDKSISDLQRFFDAAKARKTEQQPRSTNLRLDAMAQVLDERVPLFIHCHKAQEITDAIRFCSSNKLKPPVLVEAEEVYKVLELVKQSGASVLPARVHSLPLRAEDDIDQPYKTPALLQRAGIPFAFQQAGDMEAMNARNLPFTAGTATAYGLPYEEAVKALTLAPAVMLGAEKQVGSLEVGKRATLFVSEGDALNMSTNRIGAAFIDGRQLDLGNEQVQLYERYKNKYGIK